MLAGHVVRFSRGSGTRGFTLLELLLVLVLIVVLYSLSMPALKRPLATQRLKKAADLVRSEWAMTRVSAMRTGQIHVFQFQPASGQCRVTPWLAYEDAVEANDATVYGPGDGVGLAPSRAIRDQLVQLPEGITVVSSETGDIRSTIISQDLSGLNDQDTDWSSPIFFYPDGTTSDARLVLANPYDNRITVRLRGLTGMASYNAADSEEELP